MTKKKDGDISRGCGELLGSVKEYTEAVMGRGAPGWRGEFIRPPCGAEEPRGGSALKEFSRSEEGGPMSRSPHLKDQA